jgi:broad specificity phosphatase PhoE
MPTTVLLIRHPESAWNRRGIYQGQQDIPLSPLGRIQAELVAARLSRERVTGIVCSPLQRAHRMAKAIGRYHHLTPVPDERLTEISHGPWEGLSRDDCEDQFPEMFRTWTEQPHAVTFPQGESLQHVHDRAMPLLEELLARPEEETWVVATHDTVCRLAVAAAEGRQVTGFSDVNLENAGITTLVGPTLRHSVKHVNDVAHLGDHRVDLGVQAL